MDKQNRVRLKARATVILLAVCGAQSLVFLLSAATQILAIDPPPLSFAVFGGVTAVLASVWIQEDAQHAFEVADRKGFLIRDDEHHRIRTVRRDCPKLWLVVLHLELHPELMES
ncbi:hypothetical protein ACXIVK_32590 [Paraburkholderia caledonica]